MNVNSIIVKVNLSPSAQSTFDEFFKFVKGIDCKKGKIFMLDNMLAIQMYSGSLNPHPEDALAVLTGFVNHLKELASVFEKEALS